MNQFCSIHSEYELKTGMESKFHKRCITGVLAYRDDCTISASILAYYSAIEYEKTFKICTEINSILFEEKNSFIIPGIQKYRLLSGIENQLSFYIA